MIKYTITDVKKLLLEFSIIVIGVFVALAAESWWSDRENRQFEADLIEDMKAEFISNIAILESDIEENVQIAQKLNSFTLLTDTELLELDNDYFKANLRNTINWAGFDPIIGNIQALVESGNLNVISDRKLRLLLSRWSGLYIRSKRFNLQTVNFQNNQLKPLRIQFSSDLNWDESERRSLMYTYKDFVILHEGVLLTQKELLMLANEINNYLIELDK